MSPGLIQGVPLFDRVSESLLAAGPLHAGPAELPSFIIDCFLVETLMQPDITLPAISGSFRARSLARDIEQRLEPAQHLAEQLANRTNLLTSEAEIARHCLVEKLVQFDAPADVCGAMRTLPIIFDLTAYSLSANDAVAVSIPQIARRIHEAALFGANLEQAAAAFLRHFAAHELGHQVDWRLGIASQFAGVEWHCENGCTDDEHERFAEGFAHLVPAAPEERSWVEQSHLVQAKAAHDVWTALRRRNMEAAPLDMRDVFAEIASALDPECERTRQLLKARSVIYLLGKHPENLCCPYREERLEQICRMASAARRRA